MRIAEITDSDHGEDGQQPEYFDQNIQQYADRVNDRVSDSGPMQRMWQSLQDSGKILPSFARQADDYLGLMSKCGPRGNCALARFRSANMLRIQLDKRTGKKIAVGKRSGITPEEYEKYGIHIEHSIPVNVKLKLIEAKHAAGKLNDYQSFAQMYTMLSVGVAMTRTEEKRAVMPGFHRTHPDVAGNLSTIDLSTLRPFARYTNDIVIYDMHKKTKVDNQTTLGELQ